MITLISPDNDPALLRPLQEAFGRENLRLLIHSDSTDQTDQLFEDPPEVVLLDWVPPLSRGLALVRRIGERLPGTAIILLADNLPLESVVKAIKYGATDVLHNPFTAEDLVNLGQQVLQLNGVKVMDGT